MMRAKQNGIRFSIFSKNFKFQISKPIHSSTILQGWKKIIVAAVCRIKHMPRIKINQNEKSFVTSRKENKMV